MVGSYPDNPNFVATTAPVAGATTSTFNSNGYTIGNSGTAVGDSGLVQPDTGSVNPWAAVDLDLTTEVTVHMGFRTPPVDVSDTRKETGFKDDPIASIGLDNGGGSPAMFVRHDPTVIPTANWALVTDVDGASGLVTDTGIPVLPDTDYVFTFVTDATPEVLLYVDGVLTNAIDMSLITGPVGRPYTCIQNTAITPGSRVLSGVRWSLDYGQS